MREIKFRAWVSFDGMGQMYSHQMLDDSDKSGLIHLFDVINGVERGVFIMQYTGLKDKNRVEIYEGDVVRATAAKNHVMVGQVIYSPRGAEFTITGIYNGQPTLWSFSYLNSLHGQGRYEVIGNIYENPELLLNKER